jgi:hypothetical protein
MKTKNAPVFSITWLIAIILVILYAMGNVGTWALWVAAGCVFGPFILVLALSVLAAVLVMLSEK